MLSELVADTQNFLSQISDWRELVGDTQPKATNCGPVYELETPNSSTRFGFAIADMRGTEIASPHYHTNGETEIYFVLEGSGHVVLGGKERVVKKGDVVVIPPDTAHFVYSIKGLVLAVVNQPSFNPKNCIDLAESDPAVKFDLEQYKLLTSSPQC